LRWPVIICWPGWIPAGRVSNETMHEVDTLTTFAAIAGAAVPTDRPIDGVAQTDFLLGRSKASNRQPATSKEPNRRRLRPGLPRNAPSLPMS
jgi:arylsulfatase A-like enzyme